MGRDPLIAHNKLLQNTVPAANMHAAAEIKSIKGLRFWMPLQKTATDRREEVRTADGRAAGFFYVYPRQ